MHALAATGQPARALAAWTAMRGAGQAAQPAAERALLRTAAAAGAWREALLVQRAMLDGPVRARRALAAAGVAQGGDFKFSRWDRGFSRWDRGWWCVGW